MIALQAIYRFNIASQFASRVEISYDELSHSTGLSLSNLQRILRSAMANRIFRELRPGFVAHTPASKMLETTPLMQQWLGVTCEEMWPAATHVRNAACSTAENYLTVYQIGGGRSRKMAGFARAKSFGNNISSSPRLVRFL